MFSPWPAERLDELVELVAAAVPGESLTPDELQSAWDGAEVIGPSEARAAALVAPDPTDPERLALHLLVVHPGARRQGLGRALLGHVESMARAQGRAAVVVGGGGLWPGVDVVAMPALLGLLDDAAYEREGTELCLALPAMFRAPAPDGVEIRRVLDERDVDAVRTLDPKVDPRVVEHGTCFLARRAAAGGRGAPLAFASHSVGRIGWLGPHRGMGPGAPLLLAALAGELCRDLAVANRAELWIPEPGDLAPWLRLGASVGRVFGRFSRRIA